MPEKASKQKPVGPGRIKASLICTLWAWLIAAVLYLVLTFPLEWSEYGDWIAVSNKVFASGLGHAFLASLIFVAALFVDFRRLSVRMVTSAILVALLAMPFADADTIGDWLRATAAWITAGSMPFIFNATTPTPELTPN